MRTTPTGVLSAKAWRWKAGAVGKFVSEKLRLSHSWSRPRVLQIETHNRCNLECPMCPYPMMTRENGYMDFELFKKLIDEVSEVQDSVGLTHFTEPLLFKDLCRYISYGKEKGLVFGMPTNAVALTEKWAHRLIDCHLDEIIVSFDGATKETYEILRKGADFDKAIKNVERMMEIKAQRGVRHPKVTIQFVRLKQNEHELDAWRELWKSRSDHLQVMDGHNFAVAELTNMMLENAAKTLGHCGWPWWGVCVLCDGKVVPCCYDYDGIQVLGDANEKPLREIFQDVPMREFRRAHASGRARELDLCRNCPELFER